MMKLTRGKKIGLGMIIALVVLAQVFFTRFFLIKFFPHARIIISLPFAAANDDVLSINPMGETDNHPKPQNPHGHPGIDFLWPYRAPITAASSGRVSNIKTHRGGPLAGTTVDVEVTSGIYAVRYTEIEASPHLAEGHSVNQGDLIGYAGEYPGPTGSHHYTMHWEFDYDTPVYDRLCPVTYFDADSRTRLQTIWASVGDTHHGRFPDICSGDYQKRHD